MNMEINQNQDMENPENEIEIIQEPKGNKAKIIILIASILVVIIGITVALLPIGELLDMKKDGGVDVVVAIPEGATSDDIADILIEKGIVESKFAFKIKLKLFDDADNLKFGIYNLNTSMTITQVLKELTKGGNSLNTIHITVPEGYSAEMIADLVEKNGICTKEKFLTVLKEGNFDYAFLKEVPDNPDIKYKLQGFLFPSTYECNSSTTAESLINNMLKAFEDNVKDIKGNDKLSYYEIITLASLVEREAQLDSERSKIAGVFMNRLKVNMPLQVDATVIYACSDGMYDMDVVLYSDLNKDSPYNTYKYPGIPVGPICNPGLKAIRAVVNPEEHKFLYYHTDETKKDGSHIFTENYNEHQATMN